MVIRVEKFHHLDDKTRLQHRHLFVLMPSSATIRHSRTYSPVATFGQPEILCTYQHEIWSSPRADFKVGFGILEMGRMMIPWLLEHLLQLMLSSRRGNCGIRKTK